MRHRWALAAALVCAISWTLCPSGRAAQEFAVPPPPLSPDYYPCMENCHKGMKPNPTPRELEGDHTDIKLHHAEQFRWCLDCHDATNRDKLHLQNGDRIDFSESYRLCGQCHGDKYRDWKNGIHGKRTGYWNGRKEYLLCAHCHNPHSPRFAAVKPEPPPQVDGATTLRSHQRKKAGEHPTKKH